ncbi:hypothetical protein SAM40697_3602 [Streptomyces ambofaciens]|uniref:Secreted protein n=1 Tax=Streptomyces ambofaciens TaxID=1889 RepID=A0ABM6B1K5_STRAM|nr:hypothetical protein [Streptomyces ambofaciens]ANB07560.1 hypothetical protein SAM40697_3602 [Streptomyces ambofaciens]
MLRSVLVAAFSAVVAFGALNGLVTAQGDERANGVESVMEVSAASVGQDTTATTNDTVWS